MGYTVHNFQPNEVLHASELNEMDAQILKNVQNTATIQTTNVAVKNYEVGEYLTYEGILYEVTSPIATGGTITPGSNCAQTNMGAELAAANTEIAAVKESLTKKSTRIYEWATNYFNYTYLAAKADENEVDVYGYIGLNSPLTSGTQYNLFGLPDLTATWSTATVYSGVTFLGVPFYLFPYTSDRRYFQIIPRGAITASDYIIMNMTIQR